MAKQWVGYGSFAVAGGCVTRVVRLAGVVGLAGVIGLGWVIGLGCRCCCRRRRSFTKPACASTALAACIKCSFSLVDIFLVMINFFGPPVAVCAGPIRRASISVCVSPTDLVRAASAYLNIRRGRKRGRLRGRFDNRAANSRGVINDADVEGPLVIPEWGQIDVQQLVGLAEQFERMYCDLRAPGTVGFSFNWMILRGYPVTLTRADAVFAPVAWLTWISPVIH